MSWLKIFKKLSFWSVIFSYSTWQWTISPLDCDVQQKVDFTWQPVMTSSVAGLRRSSKALPKAKLDQKLRLYSLVFCCPSDPLQLSKSKQNHYIWEVYSANQWNAPKTAMPVPALVNRKGPVLLHDNAQPQVTQRTLQKLNELGYKVLHHLPYSPDFLPTDCHFFKQLNNFLQGKCFYNQQETENAFQEFTESWSTDFYATEINKHFSLAKMCLL